MSATFSEPAPGLLTARAFSAEEAAVLRVIAADTPAWAPAVINDGNVVDRTIRDADVLQADANPRLVGMCHQRLLAITSAYAARVVPEGVLGEMQFVRYVAGGGYRDHRDSPNPTATTRVLSLLCYLNDDFTGGETVFPELDVVIRPQSGLVVAFGPTLLHRADPVTAGTKFAITAWYHARR